MDSYPGSDRMPTPYIAWQTPMGTIHVSTASTALSENREIFTKNSFAAKALFLLHPRGVLYTNMGMPSTSRSALRRLKNGWAVCGNPGAEGGEEGSTTYLISTQEQRSHDG